MGFLEFFIVITGIYFVTYFIDLIFRTCYFHPYLRLLENTGFDIGIGNITWHTTYFNRSLQTWRFLNRKLLYRWFDIGILSTFVILPIAIYILTKQLITSVTYKKTPHDSQVILDAIIPGINIPSHDIWLYVFTLAVSSVIHELGHFLAARLEDVSICNVGFMFMYIIPIAFVRLNSYQLHSLNANKQLRVACAGIWQNIVLTVIVYCFMIVLPMLLEPLYDVGKGVNVKSIDNNSPINGPKGLLVGDHLSAINDCEISGSERWRFCLRSTLRQPPPGYCVTEDLVQQIDESVPLRHDESGIAECCDSKKMSTHLCFEAVIDQEAVVETPFELLQHSCLPARLVIAGTSFACRKPNDCPSSALHCIRPLLPGNRTKLLRIQRASAEVVIFTGDPLEVLHSVHVTDYVPKYPLFLSREFPDTLFKLCAYIVALSSGLAFVNAVPCFYTDGNYIIHALLRLFAVKSSQQRTLAFLINAIGTFLLFANLFLILKKYILS